VVQRRRPARSPVVPDVAPIPLDAILAGPRPGRADSAADAVWLALRSARWRAECGTPFDPRERLALDDRQTEQWRADRRVWAQACFRDDPRVRPCRD
jgi:hypothetical protein